MIPPTRAETRRLRVLVVAICSPRPSRAVQRVRLWAIVWTASQAALAAKRPAGRWFSPTPYLRSRIAVGDEVVIAVGGEEGELGTGRRLRPPDVD